MRDEYIIAKGVYTDQGITMILTCKQCGEPVPCKYIPRTHTFTVRTPHLCSQHGVVTLAPSGWI